MRAIALLFLLSAAAPSAATAQTAVFPLSEVRPGQPCAIRTAGPTGAIVELSCRVMFTDRTLDAYEQIQVRVEHPDRVLGDLKGTNGVMGGMSGSPLYIAGRLAGLVAQTRGGLVVTIAWCTPIEAVLAAPVDRSYTERTDAGESQVFAEGEPFFTCLVWGDVNLCTSGTVGTTDAATGLVYLLGHENDTWDERGRLETGRGEAQLPLWRTRVDGFSLNREMSNVETYPVGPVAGTIVWHGEYGFVADTSRRPRPTAVTLSLDGKRYSFSVAAGLNANAWMQWAVSNLYRRTLNENRECSVMTISVSVDGIPERLRLRETVFFQVAEEDAENAHSAWARLNNWVFRYNRPRFRVAAIEIEADYSARCTLFMPVEIRMSDAGAVREVQLDGLRESDLRQVRIVSSIPAPSGPVRFSDGVNLQKLILQQGTLAEVAVLLNSVEDRSALYAYEFADTEYVPHTDPTLPLGVQVRKPQVRILGPVDLKGMSVRMKDDEAITMNLQADESAENLLEQKPKP